jgi:Polymerase beta, Nucleotidyltransferase
MASWVGRWLWSHELAGEGAVLRELLGARREERAGLLQRVRVALEEDARVCAAWLFGSCARGDDDALSDLDLTVVVSDDAMPAVAGDPSRPVDYRHVLDSPRGRSVAQVSDPLLLLEAPQNAPPGGAFLTSFFAGEAGLQQVDWEWQPHSTARLPPESLLLFDRAGIPRQTGPIEVGQPGPTPDRTPYEVAAHAVPWFWATLIWNAKHAARTPQDTEMLMLGPTVRAVHDVEQFLDPDVAPLAGEPILEHPQDRPRILLDLTDRMETLMSCALPLSADIPPEVPQQARRYLQLVEEIMRRCA